MSGLLSLSLSLSLSRSHSKSVERTPRRHKIYRYGHRVVCLSCPCVRLCACVCVCVYPCVCVGGWVYVHVGV